MQRSVARLLCLSVLVALATIVLIASAAAQVVLVPTTPQVGTQNPTTAEPLVPRPETKPCVVQLFQNLAFADFSVKSFSYTPPAACPGPWAKVVFTADFTVTAGRQFDRTAKFYLGGSNIYFGTTAEPRRTLSPSWHVERDVTDLTAIFKTAQTGTADLGNLVNSTFTGIIYGNAELEFYPASWEDRAPRTADVVVPVNGTVNVTTDQVTQALNLPTNVEQVFLDVIAQSQANDEFWYVCVPNDQTGPLQSCGNTAFRETEVTIDGKAAGVAPVYPWIYTGGIDPFLWEPIPGVQTLNFKPYRVDLTPFAGVLSDGSSHTVGIGVYNANHNFVLAANLLAFTDHGGSTVTGGVISNDLAAPTPVVTENVKTDASGNITGGVTVVSDRSFAIKGFVNTSHGRIETTVEQTVDFSNQQQFNIPSSGTLFVQDAVQKSTVHSEVRTHGGSLEDKVEQDFSYPLTLDFSFVVHADGTSDQTTTIAQQDLVNESRKLNGWKHFSSNLSDGVNTTDTLAFDASGNLVGPMNGKSSETFFYRNSAGRCFSRTVNSVAQVLTSFVDGVGCDDDRHDHDR